MNQKELLHKLNTFVIEHPEYEIHFLVNSDELSDYTWTAHQMQKVELGYWYVHDETVFTNPDDYIEVLMDECEDITEDEGEIMAYDKMDKCILVYTGA